MKKHIPNLLTLLNLLSGCLGIYFVFTGYLDLAAYSIWIAAIFDFLDGFIARLLGVSSPIGKELDSLADMVTFGVLPSFILLMYMDSPYTAINFIPLALALFSALRLARFNIDDSQSESFLGLPTPAAAFFVSGIPFWALSYSAYISWPLILIISVILSILLVLPVRLMALKFKDYSFTNNWQRYLLLLLSLILLLTIGAKSLPIIITVYFLESILLPQSLALKS